MIRFLENHDEERIASKGFAQNPWYAIPAMIISATLSSGPVMIYFGQEVGEPGEGNAGFATENNRTTIFDYWGVPEHQKWMNYGKFDGGLLSEDQRNLRQFYVKLLNVTAANPAIRAGKFYELSNQPGFTTKHYAYVRFLGEERVLVIANFNREETLRTNLLLPDDLKEALAVASDKPLTFRNLLTQEVFSIKNTKEGIPVQVKPSDAWLLSF
jgi:glycosidase